VADDDEFIRRLVVTTLEDVSDVRLIQARDGAEAVAIATQEQPALVLLDLAMPNLDGVEACRRLRAEPRTRDARIVMLTAYSGEDQEARAAAAGADRYLTKPFSPLDLLRLVDELAANGGSGD
jgi:CheY-like chemotaxis protein